MKLVIESDGTTIGTTITIDGVKQARLQRVEFSADVDEPVTHFRATYFSKKPTLLERITRFFTFNKAAKWKTSLA